MLFLERDTMEKYNLVWNTDLKKYELPFDPKILNDYDFVDSNFLGKEKHCVSKISHLPETPEKAKELLRFNRLLKEFSADYSKDIILLAKQAIGTGIVKYHQILL